MRSNSVVIVSISSQQATQMRLVEDDDMIEALSSARADELFKLGILPG